MASPLRPDPEERRREYEELERERMERRAAAGAGFAWWWVFWIVIIALAIWWAGWGWGGTGGWWWGRTTAAPAYVPNGAAGSNGTAGTNNGAATANANNGTTPNGTGQPAISGPGQAVLNATDKNAFAGKHFQVNDVPVQNKINNQVLWVGADNATPMLVILAGNGNSAANAHVDNGSLVNVTGTVEKAPPRAQAKNQWSLSDDDADRLEREGVYIRATQVQAVHP